MSPSKTVPSSPRDVKVEILSDKELAVRWLAPQFNGGNPIAGYKVQFDTDLMFDYHSETVYHHTGQDNYFYVVSDLDASEDYFVRVLAYSANGYSSPALATLREHLQSVELSLVETAGTVSFSETFILSYENRTTDPISVLATSQEVEDELNKLGLGAVVVDREDHSEIFDASSIETNYFDIRYKITLITEEDVVITVNSNSLGSIVATLE